jgi:aryl-alcohol dehydrogenase-like predicted oxidoreductase
MADKKASKALPKRTSRPQHKVRRQRLWAAQKNRKQRRAEQAEERMRENIEFVRQWLRSNPEWAHAISGQRPSKQVRSIRRIQARLREEG